MTKWLWWLARLFVLYLITAVAFGVLTVVVMLAYNHPRGAVAFVSGMISFGLAAYLMHLLVDDLATAVRDRAGWAKTYLANLLSTRDALWHGH